MEELYMGVFYGQLNIIDPTKTEARKRKGEFQ